MERAGAPQNPQTELARLKARVGQLEKQLANERERHVSDSLAARLSDLTGSFSELPESQSEPPLSIVVLGASGDLARKKTFPVLFMLYCHGLLPKTCNIVGYARTKMADDEFRKSVSTNFNKSKVAEYAEAFLKLCTYHAGNYDSTSDFEQLAARLAELESKATGRNKGKANRIFYLAVPPSVFIPSAQAIGNTCQSNDGWVRVVVEKPFGRDLESSQKLNHSLAEVFREEQLYRIDHYLGKELVQNMLVLRFGNRTIEPLLNNQHVSNVQITFKEPFGTEGRGGYFDEYGIIRDVMQNHLLQILALLTMETPVTLSAEDIRDEKVKTLRYVLVPEIEQCVVGQYVGDKEGKKKGYKEDKGVPADSKTPTFCSAVFYVNSPRWQGVPFILKCGKALNERKAEVRIQFRGSLLFPNSPPNELVIRVQPDEAIWLKLNTKQPGLSNQTEQVDLNITYKERFKIEGDLPDAYERLILDVIRGDHSLFVREDELEVAWRIFTPLLQKLDDKKVEPYPYEYGSRGPAQADELAKQVGYRRNEEYTWRRSAAL